MEQSKDWCNHPSLTYNKDSDAYVCDYCNELFPDYDRTEMIMFALQGKLKREVSQLS
jgi:hypothetical protein